MSEETAAGATEQPSARKRMGKIAWDTVAQSFEGMRWMTEKTVGMLRLFATTALFLIVIFVVWNAIQSAKTVVVKPFSVPKRMVDTHGDAGRIVANILKQELVEAEKGIARVMNQDSNDSIASEISPFITGGNQRTYVQGAANIKLPETGISIDDVVEFLASIFGRENITGSVYEDQGKLYLQVELKGRIFLFARDLADRADKSLNLDLLADMLRESRDKILSVASEEYNLYFYCTEETEDIEYKNGDYQKWFDYCTKLRSRDISPEKVRQLQTELGQLDPEDTNGNAVLSSHILTLLKGKVQQKAELLCLNGETPKGDAGCQPETKTALLEVPVPAFMAPSREAPAPAAETSAEASAETQPAEAAEDTIVIDPTPAPAPAPVAPPALPVPVKQLEEKCRDALETDNSSVLQSVIQQSAATTSVSPQDTRLSNQLEADATTLLRNKLFDKAAARFEESIKVNCRNVYAWANLGYLYTRPDNPGRDLEQAQQALLIATRLNSTKGWIWNSLCEAEVYANTGNMEETLKSNSCQQARALEPVNVVLYDKLIYIAIADEYMRRNKYQEAADAYQKSMQTDKKRDCRMQGVLTQLAALETQHNISGAQQAACAIIKDAYTPPDAPPSECTAELDAFAAGC
ncbi:MAG: hypothetical protein KJ914_04250 [Gammaproteobacteria bacterium]|nr:hypothetical protein [Gammaproteobacteria bacterium]MBU1723021.1 hypothetical protein [Gammaproteobacteria bacterium]MBU2003822.1 hypothetical protein [Gammaproteobacteria bacterium]